MKGTVLRSKWPAPANNKADSNANSDRPTDDAETMSRVTFALLDEYSIDQGRRGYNPYDTRPVERNDVWRRKPKRD